MVAKYLDERIPRYTSYPTAPHFSAAVTPDLYRDWLAALPDSARLSLYLHVPFCDTLCWYCGCNTSVTRRREPIDRYVALLRREIAMVAETAGSRHVAHLHWGGGTPTMIGPDHFRATMDLLRALFSIEAQAEIAVEIDPRRLDDAMARALGLAGVTRASIGVQSFDPHVQAAIARVQSLAETQDCVALLRDAGIGGLNVDLLYGLPHQTIDACVATVQAALSLRPDRFSVFGYAHVPGVKKHQAVIDSATLPAGLERLAQEQAIGQSLMEAGYERIGLDHYALPDDGLARARRAGRLRRNFQGYTDDPADAVIGLGASSIGRLPQGFVQNATGLRDWQERIAAGELATVRGYALSADDQLRAEIIAGLMCDLRADLPALLRRHDFPADWLNDEMAALAPLVADGLARLEDGVLVVPEAARMLVRRVACQFDAYLDRTARRHAVAV